MDLPLQIGVAVYHLAKLRMLQFYYDFIDKYIDRSDFELLEMDTDSNYFAFSEDNIDKIIKPHMREEYEKDKLNFLPSESEELHPTFKVDDKPFTLAAYDKRTPGRFKVETKKILCQHLTGMKIIFLKRLIVHILKIQNYYMVKNTK